MSGESEAGVERGREEEESRRVCSAASFDSWCAPFAGQSTARHAPLGPQACRRVLPASWPRTVGRLRGAPHTTRAAPNTRAGTADSWGGPRAPPPPPPMCQNTPTRGEGAVPAVDGRHLNMSTRNLYRRTSLAQMARQIGGRRWRGAGPGGRATPRREKTLRRKTASVPFSLFDPNTPLFSFAARVP